LRPARRENALREQGIGANKNKLSHKHNPFTGYVQAPKPSKNRPSNGAIGAAFYQAMFVKAGAK
jgi:hypothetical protein